MMSVNSKWQLTLVTALQDEKRCDLLGLRRNAAVVWMACTLRRPEKRVREGKRGQRPIHLYLIFEKSSLKNQVRQTGFLTCKN